MFFSVVVAKPGADASTVYVPMGRPAMLKCPAASAVAVWMRPVASLRTTRVAFAMRPPLASATVPSKSGAGGLRTGLGVVVGGKGLNAGLGH